MKLGDIDGPEHIEKQIRQVFIHPKYNKGQVYFNVAVLKIDRVQYSETINAICLPPTLDLRGDGRTRDGFCLLLVYLGDGCIIHSTYI